MEDSNKDKEVNLYKESHLLNSVFIKDTDFQYIFKKTEKIATAIYLVTNFLATQEPLKWSLRNATTGLLKSAMTFSKMSLSDREMRVHELNSSILETSSLFDLAYRSGFISNMNYEIINFEISKLSASIASYQQGSISSNKGLFDDNYFHVHKSNDFNENETDKGQIKKDILKDNTKRHYNYDLYKNNDSKASSEVRSSNALSNYPKRTKKQNKKTNTERRNLIISEIKKQGDVSVKDILKVLPNLSPKTLQRELLSMVEDGLLIKEGERRWSRYSIK